MKSLICLMLALTMICGLLLIGCGKNKEADATSAPTTSPTSQPTTAPTQTTAPVNTDPFAGVSSEELVRRMASSDALHNWSAQSSNHPSSYLGFLYLIQLSDEWVELNRRPDGMRTLEEYGPTVVGLLMESDNARTRSNGYALAELIVMLWPYKESEMDALTKTE